MMLSFRLAAMGLLAFASAQEVSSRKRLDQRSGSFSTTNDDLNTTPPLDLPPLLLSPKKMIVTFLNELPDETIDLYWMDHDGGGRHKAGSVPPRGTRRNN